jgi:hypothetical protein
MKSIRLIAFVGLLSTITFLVLAFVTTDALKSQLFAALTITAGAFAGKLLSNLKTVNNGKN